MAARLGRAASSSAPATTTRARNTTSSRCSLSVRAASTWATSATTRWATWSPATSGPGASTSCTRWAGTRSACPPRTPRWPTRSIRATWTYANIATMRGAAQVDGPVAGLAPRDRDLRSQLLQAPAAHVPGFPGGRPGGSQDREGQLGSGRPDRAGQRAGDRRPRLAIRRARRAARADAVVLPDHRVRAGTARRARHAGPLAREGAADAAQLDRPLRGPDGPFRRSTRPPRPPARRELEIYTTRPDTLFGAKFMAIAPDHPLARAAAAKDAALAAFIEECKRTGTAHRSDRQGREEGLRHRHSRRHPFDPSWELPVYVANFILMEYGTGAIFGCPAHDQRDLDFVNRTAWATRRSSARPTSTRPPSSSPTLPMTAKAR